MDQPKIKNVIKCPHCGYEYLPGELYLPLELTGKPRNVIRDALGKVLYEEYSKNEEPEMVTKYICDGCDKQFVVEATITFKSKTELEELDFKSPYVSLLD